jgi:hypothetical protein
LTHEEATTIIETGRRAYNKQPELFSFHKKMVVGREVQEAARKGATPPSRDGAGNPF